MVVNAGAQPFACCCCISRFHHLAEDLAHLFFHRVAPFRSALPQAIAHGVVGLRIVRVAMGLKLPAVLSLLSTLAMGMGGVCLRFCSIHARAVPSQPCNRCCDGLTRCFLPPVEGSGICRISPE